MSIFNGDVDVNLRSINGESPFADDAVLVERCVRLVNLIADYMGLIPRWSFCISLHNNGKNEMHAASCVWPVLYRKATISFDRAQLRSMTDEYLAHIVLHEMVHIVFATLDDYMKEEVGPSSYIYLRYHDLREGVTDEITNLMFKMLNGGKITTYMDIGKGKQ